MGRIFYLDAVNGNYENSGITMAVYIHGLCGDIAREKKGSHGMTAKDMIEALPEVLNLAEVQSKG